MDISGFISARLQLVSSLFFRLLSPDLPDRGKSRFVPAVPNRSFTKNCFFAIPASVSAQSISFQSVPSDRSVRVFAFFNRTCSGLLRRLFFPFHVLGLHAHTFFPFLKKGSFGGILSLSSFPSADFLPRHLSITGSSLCGKHSASRQKSSSLSSSDFAVRGWPVRNSWSAGFSSSCC